MANQILTRQDAYNIGGGGAHCPNPLDVAQKV